MAKKKKRLAPATPAVSIAASASQKQEFNPDYSIVKKELTRIGALAGFFFIALIVLSFFLK
ncbi:MAG: hypothetical protein LC099_07985 [Anaerolineales bacterium]|nr:hypothetical protein [Anaerolineales bacterium]